MWIFSEHCSPQDRPQRSILSILSSRLTQGRLASVWRITLKNSANSCRVLLKRTEAPEWPTSIRLQLGHTYPYWLSKLVPFRFASQSICVLLTALLWSINGPGRTLNKNSQTIYITILSFIRLIAQLFAASISQNVSGMSFLYNAW